MNDDDQDWLDALAGRDRPDADPATRREAALLRQALRREATGPVPELPDGAEALLARARAEGLVRRRWCAACAARWSAWREQLLRPGPLAGAALALVLLAFVALPLLVPPPAEEEPVLRAGEDGLVLLQDEQPAARRDRIADALAAAGAEVRRYERLGRSGLDAQWRSPTPPALSQALRGQGLAVPADGVLRVEVEPLPAVPAP